MSRDQTGYDKALLKQKIIKQRHRLVTAIVLKDEELKRIEHRTLELMRARLKGMENVQRQQQSVA